MHGWFLLAFGFLQPWLLTGLALGSIPIIIHLLHRRKYRETRWAAMKFLLDAQRKHSRRLRLEQLLLLLIRTLIIVLLTLALAQPFVDSLGTYFEARVPTQRLIVVDASLSMGLENARGSRFEQAREVARSIVANSHQGDAFNLFQIAETSPTAIIRRPAFQSGQVLRELDGLRLSDEFGDVVSTLQDVLEVVNSQTEPQRKEVYLISDYQRENWGVREDQIHNLLQQISAKADLALIDLGETGQANVAITDFEADAPFVVTGRTVPLRARVRNFSDQALPRQLVELYVDGRKRAEQRVFLEAGEEVAVDFPYLFEQQAESLEQVEHRLEVRLPADALQIDNSRFLSLPEKREIQLLLVNGRIQGSPSDWATHYVQHVLHPEEPKEGQGGLFRPQVIPERNLPGTDLSRYDCIFLCDVGLITPQEAALLQAYVESGGSLVVTMGDQVDVASYNQHLYRNGQGVLPAQLLGPVGDAQNPREEQIVTFDPVDLEHPIVQPFRGNPGSGLETAFTFRYMRVELPADSKAVEVLKFSSGAPAILTNSVGRGKCMLVTTSVDNRWSAWARENSSFGPILHELVRYAVAGRWAERQLLVGSPLVRGLPGHHFNLTARVLDPEEQEQTLELDQEGRYAQVNYPDTLHAGFYQLQLGPPLNRTEYYAVNIASRESNPAKLSEEELRQSVLMRTPARYDTRFQGLQEETELVLTERGGLSRWLLAAVFALLLVEQLMAWRFFPGLALLCAFVCGGFLWQVWHSGTLLNWLAAGLGLLSALTALLVIRHLRRSVK